MPRTYQYNFKTWCFYNLRQQFLTQKQESFGDVHTAQVPQLHYLAGPHSTLKSPSRREGVFPPVRCHEKKPEIVLISEVVSCCCLPFCPGYFAVQETGLIGTTSGDR